MRPMAELPVVDESRCTGCGDCVAVCPVECLGMWGAVPWLPRPSECVSCGVCVVVCPPQAIRLEDQD
ncbi:MAG: 4Fe-4S binding protein [Gemmataceae bacterium]|nr:4Fe-4S binding protein [Gemmataceae bacterium]MDW8264053.1 4Fe-4S binding protein [Gemmataceae bacterium]